MRQINIYPVEHEVTSLLLERWTTDLVLDMPHLETYRYEIIDGELFVTKAPEIRHQLTSGNILFLLNTLGRTTGAGVAIATPGLVYSKEDAVIPDLVWVSKARLNAIWGKQGKLIDSPEIVIEILSAGAVNEGRDRENKLDLFSRFMVPEYWVVDWRAVRVEIYRHDGNTLMLAQTLQSGDTLTSPLLPGFSCVIDRFFEFS